MPNVRPTPQYTLEELLELSPEGSFTLTPEDKQWLELSISTQRNMTMVDPRTLGLTKGRFWSSSSQLPVYRIIARVLADPTEEDLLILKQQFGIDSIMSTWSELITRGEVSESVIPITMAYLRNLILPPTK